MGCMAKNHCHVMAILMRIFITFDVRHDDKRYRVSQRIKCSLEIHFFSIVSFLNDLKFYDGEQNKLS